MGQGTAQQAAEALSWQGLWSVWEPGLGCNWVSREAGPPAFGGPLRRAGTRRLPPAPPATLRSQELLPSPQGTRRREQGVVEPCVLPQGQLAQRTEGQVRWH